MDVTPATRTATTRPAGTDSRCLAVIHYGAGAFGFDPILCSQVVGVRHFVTTGGLRVGYCAIPSHEASVRRRFTERSIEDIPEPVWLHEDPDFAPDAIDAWKAARDWAEQDAVGGAM
jgi:hypothetical protein